MPKPSELFVDIDDQASLDRFDRALATLKTGIFLPKITIVHNSPSPSGRPNRFHIVIDIGRPIVSEIERIALQAILGSDPVREALSWMHLQQGTTNVSRFFEKPQSVQTVESDVELSMNRWQHFYDLAATQLAASYAATRNLAPDEKAAMAKRFANEAKAFADAFKAARRRRSNRHRASHLQAAPSTGYHDRSTMSPAGPTRPTIPPIRPSKNFGEMLRPSPEPLQRNIIIREPQTKTP